MIINSFNKLFYPSILSRSSQFCLRVDFSWMFCNLPKHTFPAVRMYATKISGNSDDKDLAIQSISQTSGLVKNKLESPREVRPPWIAYSGILPGDSFWKYGGEAYMQDAFLPYVNSLNEDEKSAYLTRWDVPEDWAFFFDPELKEFLDELDTE